MNSYLNPLVEELQVLFSDGIRILSPDYTDLVTVRAALICSACDIPACRKVLGFYGHMSKHGCSKCTKEFKYDNAKDVQIELRKSIDSRLFWPWLKKLSLDEIKLRKGLDPDSHL